MSVVFLVDGGQSLFEKVPCGERICCSCAKTDSFRPRLPRLDYFRVLSGFSVNLFGMDQQSELEFTSSFARFRAKLFAGCVCLHPACAVEPLEHLSGIYREFLGLPLLTCDTDRIDVIPEVPIDEGHLS